MGSFVIFIFVDFTRACIYQFGTYVHASRAPAQLTRKGGERSLGFDAAAF